MKRYWQHIVRTTEKRVEDFLERQVKDPTKENYGGLNCEVIEGKENICLLTDALSLYFCEESQYCRSKVLLEAVKRGVAYTEKWQREDGSLDLPSCNFYSAPDTAFCFWSLYDAFRILKKYGHRREEEMLQEQYLTLLIRCIPIMIYGGFHTPNHRWAITSALLTMVKLVEEREELVFKAMNLKARAPFAEEMPKTADELIIMLRKRAEQYLAEGIDEDEDGEYSERSAGNYNAVVDQALILIYEMTGDASYLGYVEKNLDMMLYYFDGDDTIFTQNSTRQDYGKMLYPDQYFYLYTYMAEKTDLPRFNAAAHKIIRDNMERGDMAHDSMPFFMVHDSLKNFAFKEYGFLAEFRKYFPGSQVLRVKKPNYMYSVLKQKAAFLNLKFGSLPIGIRIRESYCDVRNFIPESLEATEGGCVLKAVAKGWYYQPFREPLETSDWWKMEHNKREQIVTSQLETTVFIKELDNGVEITVRTEGLSRLPLRVEFDIPAKKVLESDTFRLETGAGESMILRSGYVCVQNGAKKVVIGPGYGTHAFKGHYQGEEKNTSGYHIFFNDYTPYERTFRIVEEL